MKSLDELRAEIDLIDHQILSHIQKRMTITTEVQELKKTKGLPKEDLQREHNIITELQSKYPELPEGLIQDIYRILFTYSKRAQGPKI